MSFLVLEIWNSLPPLTVKGKVKTEILIPIPNTPCPIPPTYSYTHSNLQCIFILCTVYLSALRMIPGTHRPYTPYLSFPATWAPCCCASCSLCQILPHMLLARSPGPPPHSDLHSHNPWGANKLQVLRLIREERERSTLPYLTSGTVTELSAMLVDRMIYQIKKTDHVLEIIWQS